MKYRVHRLEVDVNKDLAKLEGFLNGLEGEVISIIPSIKKLSLLQIYGVKPRVDSLVVVERMP
jgi:hypothetical protein